MMNEIETAIEWMPPHDDDLSRHGNLRIDGKIWLITEWHSFDDYGQTLETVQVCNGKDRMEVYSFDEGYSWTDSIMEGDKA